MKHLSHVHRLILALLVGIVAVPMTSTALFMHQSVLERLDTDPTNIRRSALEDRSRIRAQTRLYWNAVKMFQDKKEQGIDVEKPDFNDLDSIENVHSAAPEVVPVAEESAVTSLTTDQLASHDRALLRRYTRAGFCPESLKSFYIDGFYELCTSLVGLAVKSNPVTGFLNHNAYLHQALRSAAPTLSPFKLRMQMMDQALRGSKRDSGQRHGRPTVCVMNQDCLNPRYSD